jgi:hypothetical protein
VNTMSEPTDDQLSELIVQTIRDYYHEGAWEEVVEIMLSIEKNPQLSQSVFDEAHGFISEVYDWWFNGEGPKDNVRMFDPSKRRVKKEDDDTEREA